MKDFKQQNSRSGAAVKSDKLSQIDESKLKKVLAGDVKEMNSYADYLAKEYLKGKDTEKLTTSQIRNILDDIQRMREFDENRLHLLRPKLAYVAGRHRGRVQDFQKLLDKAILMTREENFKNFKNFVEAIVAYHRYYGGK